MTTERDSRTRVVLSWLREDAHENAERVLLRALDEIDTTPQRRPWWPPRRFPNMTPAYKVGLAAAAVLVAAIVGYSLLPGVLEPGAPTSQPTEQPTASPAPSPTSTFTPILPDGRALSAGRYGIRVPGSDVTAVVTLDGSWTSGGYYIMNPPAFTRQVSFWTVGNVYDDICDAATGGLPTSSNLPLPAIGPTVADLVSALDAQVNTDMSRPVDVTVGGFTGKRVTMLIADPYEHCIGDQNARPMWVDPAGEPQRGLQQGDPDTIWIVDVAGRRVVIVTNQNPEDDEVTTATIDAVIDSIEFIVP